MHVFTKPPDQNDQSRRPTKDDGSGRTQVAKRLEGAMQTLRRLFRFGKGRLLGLGFGLPLGPYGAGCGLAVGEGHDLYPSAFATSGET